MKEIKIADAFSKGKALITFITGGDPNLATTEKLLIAMQKAGSDLIEIGIPFSDPIAEGPVIQEANERALADGCTTDKLFDTVKKVRQEETVTVPMVFLTYINPIFTYGKENFMQRCVECGINGLIIPDLPFEEKDELADVCKEYGIDIISMIAPTSKERIQRIASKATGFLYVVSSLGVTGMRSNITTDIGTMISHVREASNIPAAVGFGISNKDQAREMALKSDGAIIGSAIVKIVAKYGVECVPEVEKFIGELRQGVDAAL